MVKIQTKVKLLLPKLLQDITDNRFDTIKVQINKDFDMCGIPVLDAHLSPNQFYNHLFALVKSLHLNEHQILKNLLYRVDIRERDIEAIGIEYGVTLEEAITIAILNRTLQKIEFKKKFNI